MRRTPWFVAGSLVLCLATSAGAAEKAIGVVGGGLWNNMPELLGKTVTTGVFSQSTNQSVFGPLGGVIFELRWPTFGAARFEPKYMRKGTELWLRLVNDDEVRGPVDLDYISLPLMFKVEIFKRKPVQLVVISGLTADYLLSAKFQGDDIKDAFESWDYTVTARIGIQGKVGDGGVLGAHLNVASSLAGIDKGQPDQAKLKNNGIGFAVEYTHSLGN